MAEPEVVIDAVIDDKAYMLPIVAHDNLTIPELTVVAHVSSFVLAAGISPALGTIDELVATSIVTSWSVHGSHTMFMHVTTVDASGIKHGQYPWLQVFIAFSPQQLTKVLCLHDGCAQRTARPLAPSPGSKTLWQQRQERGGNVNS